MKTGESKSNNSQRGEVDTLRFLSQISHEQKNFVRASSKKFIVSVRLPTYNRMILWNENKRILTMR